MEVVTVYAAQAPEQQMVVFNPAPYNTRKVAVFSSDRPEGLCLSTCLAFQLTIQALHPEMWQYLHNKKA